MGFSALLRQHKQKHDLRQQLGDRSDEHSEVDPLPGNLQKHLSFLLRTVDSRNFHETAEELTALGEKAESRFAFTLELLAELLRLSLPCKSTLPPASREPDLTKELLLTQLRLSLETPQALRRALDSAQPFPEEFCSLLSSRAAGQVFGPLDREKLLAALEHSSASGLAQRLAAHWAAKMNGPNQNGQSPQLRSGDDTSAIGAGSPAVLAAALHALRQPSGTEGAAINPGQLSLFLQQLVSDAEGPEDPLLGRAQRRTLISTAVERVGPDAFARAFVEALGNLRIKKSLPAFLADIGPYAIPNADIVRAIFAKFGVSDSSPPDELSVAHLFAGLLSVPAHEINGESVTNWTALVRGLCTFRQGILWQRAIRSFDELEGFSLPHDVRFDGFAAALALAPYDSASNSHAVSGLWGSWNNKPLQLSLLAALLSVGADVFSFAVLPGRRIITSADVASASATVRQLAASSERSTWNSLDLVETLVVEAADESPETRQSVNMLLERYSKEAPDLLAMGLLQLPEPWNAYHLELAQRLLGSFFNNTAAGHQLVFYVGYQTNRNFVMQMLVRAYLSDPLKVTRIVDIAQDLKALPNLLEFRADPAKPFHFALDVAALASRREVLNADLYFDRMIREFGTAFMRAALDFLGERLRDELQQQDQDPGQQSGGQQLTNFVSPSVNTVATFLRRLRSHGESMTAEDIEAFKMVRNLALQLHPRLLPIRDSESQEPGMEVATFAQEVHDECDETFGRMYKQELSVEDVVGILQHHKSSSVPEENELFACMVHTLFDEQKWIRSYPPTELRLTAHLFGDLIQHSLIDYVPLGIAIRGCLDALRTDPGSPSFEFGLEALKRFQGRLRDWPQLAQALQALPPHPDITAIVARAAQGGDTADSVGALNSLDEPEMPVRLAFTSINPGPEIDDTEQHEPDDQVTDKVLFAINNLSPSNLESKLADVRDVLSPQIYRWFAEYLTLERCQLEPNFHGLYLRFLEAVADSKLDAHVLRETLAVAKRLINSDATVSTLQSRKALQNVGSWLGLITLARDKPIRFKHVDFKSLLIEGFDSSRLIVAVPFVAKVLEQCSKSQVFKLPNPWLNAILRVLAELYQLPELKLNLRFEIEVLCKSLGVELKDIQPSAIIRSRELLPPQGQASVPGLQQQQQAIAGVPTAEMERLGLGGAAARSVQEQQRRAGAPITAAQQPAANQVAAAASAAAATAYNESVTSMLQGLPHYVQINPQLSMFHQAPLKRLLYVSIDRAIREIIGPVVERSVTIASISTRELVSKDFAMEGDERKMRDAAHQMAANLAGSLALVTCKEPLRISMVSHARTLFLQSGFNEQTLPEQALMGVMQDNLELACSVIEKAAMDKAMPEVDDGLAGSYTARRDHRRRSRGFFWDSNALAASQYAATLPDGLRLKPEGLQPQQYRVYQDFGNLTRSLSSGGVDDERGHAAGAAAAAAAAAAAGGAGTAGPSPVPASGPPQLEQFGYGGPDVLTAQQSLEKFGACIAEVERLLAQAGPDESITSLPQGHELRDVVRQVPIIATQSQNRDEAALVFSQKVVQLMFKSETSLSRDVFVILLERLCEVSFKVAKEVTAWLMYAEDERKFNVPVTVSLIRAGLMNIAETDVQVTKLLVREFRPNLVDYAANLALECLREPACATRGQLANITEALTRAAQQGKATPAATQFLDELKVGNLNTKTDVSNGPLREQLAFCFSEWVRNSQLSPNSEKLFIDFVTSLQSQGILKGEEISSMFFRVCTEVAVDGYIKSKAAGGSLATGIFCPVDSLAKMIVLMIKYHADASGANNEQAKVNYLAKILSIIVLVLAQSHEELDIHFQQKPFYRLFSSLLHELKLAEASLEGAYQQTLLAMGNTLSTLQPSFFPTFTFSWMSLVSHRLFMPKLLSDRQEGWPAFHRLLCSLLRFLGPLLCTSELQETSRSLYKGTLRTLVVLLHDFPEFLAAYHYSLCDLVPDNCIQMRNLLSSAFPRDRRLPDPFQPNLKMEQLPESSQPPLVLSDYQGALTSQGSSEFKRGLLQYLEQRGPASFLSTIKDVVLVQQRGEEKSGAGGEEDTTAQDLARVLEVHHKVPLINSIVMTCMVSALERPANLLASGGVSGDAAVDVVSWMVKNLDAEGRFYVLSACANQLRFPSSHTAYMSHLLLYLYRQHVEDEEVKGQILRVLMERIIVNRPHPWGTLCTTFELLRNAHGQYALPRGMPLEIERLLDHVRAGLESAAGGGGGGAVNMGGGPLGGRGGAGQQNGEESNGGGVGTVGSGFPSGGNGEAIGGTRGSGSRSGNLGAVGAEQQAQN